MNEEKKEFRLSEEFFQHFRRATLTRALPLMLLAGAAGLVMARAGSGMPLPLTIALCGGILLVTVLSTRRSYRQQAEHLRGFRLVLSADGLHRTQPGLTDVFIQAEQISRVVDHPGKNLTVYGQTPRQAIRIPATTEGFEQIRARVEAWRPATVSAPSPLARQLPVISSVATTGALVTVFMSDNAVLVTTLGLALIAVLGWGFFSLRRDPNLDAKVRRSVWFILLPLYAIAVRVWSMWAGGPGG